MTTHKMQKFVGGGEVFDEMEMANSSAISQAIADEANTAGLEARGQAMLEEMRDKETRVKPKAAPVAKKPKAVEVKDTAPAKKSTPTPAAAGPIDLTKMSLAERAKMSRDSARAGSGSTDKRSVNERIRSALGMKSGGSVSASKRGDGIAQRGKTRGKMC